jgi:hypothetical protein
MTIHFRLPRTLFDRMQQDLSRPHEIAAERVGFLYVRQGAGDAGSLLVIGSDYVPVADDHYLEDAYVGARIAGQAIRSAMQRALDTGEGVFHVHRHDHRGRPWFSRVDQVELRKLVPSFQNVGPMSVHGALLLSLSEATALVWPSGHQEPVGVVRVSLIGQPMSFFGRW